MPHPVSSLPPIDGSRRTARILIVDDQPANLIALEGLLQPLGHTVVKAASGEEALSYLLHDDVALILMDVRMPKVDGLETARMIRSRPRTQHIPIIFVTALSREAAYVTQGYAEGAVDYLLKPIDADILRAKVKVFVDLYLRGEQLKAQAIELERQRQRQEELERATAFEQRLIGIVGHDIRTPLTAILLSARQQLKSPTLAADSGKAFERITRGAERILAIAELLMDFTRSSMGQGIPIRRERADLRDTVRSVLDETRTAHPSRTFELVAPTAPVEGCWDGARVAQLLGNLVDNAVKYGSAQKPIRLELAPEHQGHVAMRVHNHGEPIPHALLGLLFQPFQRGANEVPGDRSLGLGLFIAREIARAHDGELTVRSSREDGTTFEVVLPVVWDLCEEPPRTATAR